MKKEGRTCNAFKLNCIQKEIMCGVCLKHANNFPINILKARVITVNILFNSATIYIKQHYEKL